MPVWGSGNIDKNNALCFINSFVSEHIETLEEIDVEYRELAFESGITNWGRVPALGCEQNFIRDLADAVIEALPYVGAMAVSNIEARQVCFLKSCNRALKVEIGLRFLKVEIGSHQPLWMLSII